MKYDEITTCELENALNINQSKVSYHLLNLLDSDIVERRTYGPWSFYRLKDKVGIFEMFRVIGLDEDTLQTFV
jgi:DNA-binding transcriptional ArsR family regulator